MSATSHWSYDLLKSAIAAKNISHGDLEYFKQIFKQDIESARRYATIETLDDLLDCLGRRDKLSEYNIEVLQSVAEYFADDDIDIGLEKYTPPKAPSELQNVYALQRLHENAVIKSELNSKATKLTEKPVIIIKFTEEKRDDIYKLIARDIGRDWRHFGRELLVRAGDLDKIDVKYPTDLQSRVYEIFEIFESDRRHNPMDHYDIICEALDNCKRKDVRRSVQMIMRY